MKITDKYVFFWKEYFSNWAISETPLEINVGGKKVTVPTSEQIFMLAKAQLFKDEEAVQKILRAKTPREAKELGRKVKNFDKKRWDDVSFFMMSRAVIVRFNQDKKFREMLMDEKFRDKEFVEASPYDKIWGIGMAEDDPDIEDESKWKGQNKLGQCLTIVRKGFLLVNERALI